MRVLLCILVLLPIVWCASIDERFILDTFGLDNFSVHDAVAALRKTFSSDTSEAVCEAGCPAILISTGVGALASLLCHPACELLRSTVEG